MLLKQVDSKVWYLREKTVSDECHLLWTPQQTGFTEVSGKHELSVLMELGIPYLIIHAITLIIDDLWNPNLGDFNAASQTRTSVIKLTMPPNLRGVVADSLTYRNIILNLFRPFLSQPPRVHSLQREYTGMYLAPVLHWILGCTAYLFFSS